MSWRTTTTARIGTLAGLALLAGCASRHSTESALSPSGPQASRLAGLFWIFVVVSAVVWALVMLFFGLALWKNRAAGAVTEPVKVEPDLKPDERRERRLQTAVATSVGVTLVVLLVLLVGEFATARVTHRFGDKATNQVSVQVTGHQWWWEIEYQDGTPSNCITTANELVIPVGRPVEIKLQSHDVIHSFWVPNLHGKKDLVPGHPASLWFQADRPGVYWGECAEFCGYQHAQMRIAVKALAPAEFDTWLAASRQNAKAPTTESERRGQQVFLASSCVLCHQINGLHAFGRIGPDLTHVSGRMLIAAGALEHTRDNLARWLDDPQAVKPGTQMPKTELLPADRQALVDYLESLK